VNGIDYTTLLASVAISENQWFNCVFQDDCHPKRTNNPLEGVFSSRNKNREGNAGA